MFVNAVAKTLVTAGGHAHMLITYHHATYAIHATKLMVLHMMNIEIS